jgi:hypothetical protein
MQARSVTLVRHAEAGSNAAGLLSTDRNADEGLRGLTGYDGRCAAVPLTVARCQEPLRRCPSFGCPPSRCTPPPISRFTQQLASLAFSLNLFAFNAPLPGEGCGCEP